VLIQVVPALPQLREDSLKDGFQAVHLIGGQPQVLLVLLGPPPREPLGWVLSLLHGLGPHLPGPSKEKPGTEDRSPNLPSHQKDLKKTEKCPKTDEPNGNTMAEVLLFSVV
jgi:hypothetical protein